MRVGQKNGLVYQWAKKGTRPRQPKDQRYANAYVFGAVCPARDAGAALVMPRADTEAMQKHLEEISLNVAAGAQAVLILDKAGQKGTGQWTLINAAENAVVVSTINAAAKSKGIAGSPVRSRTSPARVWETAMPR